MKNDFEARMRAGELFHALRSDEGAFPIVRVDGHGFSRFTERHFEKPFDPRFRDFMLQAAQTLLEELGGVYAYCESDEISILLPLDWNGFNRELEKTVSLAAGLASATFSLACGQVAYFDGRVWLGENEEAVVDYFRWRQGDATRAALNGWCYWTLRQNGHSAQAATKLLDRQTSEAKIALLAYHGIHWDEVPAWQRRGVGLFWEEYEKQGVDPVRGVEVTATRRRIAVEMELPERDEYGRWVMNFLLQDSGGV